MARSYRQCWRWAVVVLVGTAWLCTVWLEHSTSNSTFRLPRPALIKPTLAVSHNTYHKTYYNTSTPTKYNQTISTIQTVTHAIINTPRSVTRHETSGSSDPSNTNAQQVTTAPGRRHQHQDAGQLPSAAQKNSLTSDWESAMSERRARVSHICRRHYKTLKRFTVFDRLTFDTKHHLAYCRNAKAGTTSWLRTLLEWAGEDVSNMTSLQIHEAAIDTFPPLTAKDAAREMQVPPITFIMARHPFTRLVSAYRDKIPKNYKRNLQLEMIAKYRGQQINNSSSEDESSALETSLRHTKLIENKKMNDIKINSRSSHQESIVMRNDSLSVNEAPHEIQLTTNSSFMTTSDTSFPSFREFVLYVSDQVLQCLPYINSNCMKNIDVHWQPLHDRCAPCDIQYDVIAKGTLLRLEYAVVNT